MSIDENKKFGGPAHRVPGRELQSGRAQRARRALRWVKDTWGELDYAQRRLLEIQTGVTLTPEGHRTRRPEIELSLPSTTSQALKTRTYLHVQAIDPARLDKVRVTAADGHGNRLRPFAATGQGEPLRCCLRYAEPGEQITLISYAPFDHSSVWTEVGPVYIHTAPCDGYVPTGRLPERLASGPCVLRTYRSDDTMNYDHNTVVTDHADLEPIIERLLSEPDVSTVHVRTLAPQCYLYAITAA